MQTQYSPWGDNEKNIWGFIVNEGKFTDTIISINNVELNEENLCVLDFNFVNKPKNLDDNEFNSDGFNLLMQDIINDILRKAIDEHRKSNTTESTL